MLEGTTLVHLFAEISAGTTILTPNRRLAATLRQLDQEWQLKSGQQCWPTPDILPYISWIQRLWNSLSTRCLDQNLSILLTPTQESYLWENIITHSKEAGILLRTAETADLAHTAWKLLCEWRVNPLQMKIGSEDSAVMHAWAKEFADQCKKQDWIDSGNMINQITAQLSSLSMPKKILFIGFNELSPLQQDFFNTIKSQQITVNLLNLTQPSTQSARISFQYVDEELITVARWSKKMFLDHPTAQIACVVPNLATIRDRVVDIFSSVFNETYDQVPFNVSAGKNLSQYPLIIAALQQLHLVKTTLPLEKMSELLNSAFIGDAEREYIQRAKYESILRRNNLKTVHLSNLLATSSDNPIKLADYCPRLNKRLTDYYKTLNALPSKQSFAAWAHTFTELLTIMGWPGERSLNSEEYQQVEHWLRLFTNLASLDQITGPVNYQHALHSLQRLAASTVFQPRTPAARIQVLGILEAAGLPLDYLWITGLNDMTWPPQPNPNPFIPKKLQRELAMPHSTALRELEYCQQLTQQFLQSASNVIISHATHQGELELQTSPLVRHLTEISLDDLKLAPYSKPSMILYQSQLMERICDEQAPAVALEETIAGGVNILKQQALCPFKAFSEWRLYATELESPLPGLRAKDRGSLVHKTLEIIWNQLHDQQSLLNLTDEQLKQIIQTAIEEALINLPLALAQRPRYLALEKKRTAQIILEWLAVEKSRPAFSVQQHESKASITLNKLTLSMRIDRIDQLADGKKIIIDYKTGKNNDIYHWLGDRPEEPQLPLYSLLDPLNTSAISYAQLAAGEQVFKGISQYQLDITGITPVADTRKFFANSWEELTTQWQHVLTKLSDDFTAGRASVSPKDPASTCIWCALKPLCRINEQETLEDVY